MTISSVSKYKGETWEVIADGQNFYFNREIVADFGLRSGMDISEEKFSQIVSASDRRKACQRAMYLLDYRPYSFKEMFKKLSENYDEDTCFYVLNRLCELGLINDRRYASSLAEKYVEVKKYGFFRAKAEMRKKGLTDEIIREALEKYEGKTEDILFEYISKKYTDCLQDPDKIRKMKNALVRQGYGYDEINRAVRRFEISDPDEYE